MEFEQVPNPKEGPWPEIEKRMREILNGTQANIGLILLEKNGAVAAVIGGEKVVTNQDKLLESLALFQDRLSSLVEHVQTHPIEELTGVVNHFDEHPDQNPFLVRPKQPPHQNN